MVNDVEFSIETCLLVKIELVFSCLCTLNAFDIIHTYDDNDIVKQLGIIWVKRSRLSLADVNMMTLPRLLDSKIMGYSLGNTSIGTRPMRHIVPAPPPPGGYTNYF